jgi:hypothetical protein
MADIIVEPSNENPGTSDWQKNLLKMTMTTGGFLLIGLAEMDTPGVPVVMAGSRFEINGSFFCCPEDESVGGSPVKDSVNYIYAVPGPDGDVAAFRYGAEVPGWDAAKGGWYSGNDRAIAKFFCAGDGDGGAQYNGKVVLDSFGAMEAMNVMQAPPASGGYLYGEAGPANTPVEFDLGPGVWRIDLKGGWGGSGGYTTTDSVTLYGGAGAQGEEKSKVLYCRDRMRISLVRGGDGATGASATYRSGAGGGSSGAASVLFVGGVLDEIAYGGSGGGGAGGLGDSNYGGGGGGGGGGGHGTGGTGQGRNTERYGGGGAGGSNRNGGAGGPGGQAPTPGAAAAAGRPIRGRGARGAAAPPMGPPATFRTGETGARGAAVAARAASARTTPRTGRRLPFRGCL